MISDSGIGGCGGRGEVIADRPRALLGSEEEEEGTVGTWGAAGGSNEPFGGPAPYGVTPLNGYGPGGGGP